MSVHVTSLAKRQTRARYGARAVLMELCDRADDDGMCWPGINYIADGAGLSRRQAIRAIHQLREMGEVVLVEDGGGRGRKSIYRIVVGLPEYGDKESPLKAERVTNIHGKNVTVNDPKTVTNATETVTNATEKGDICAPPIPPLDPSRSIKDPSLFADACADAPLAVDPEPKRKRRKPETEIPPAWDDDPLAILTDPKNVAALDARMTEEDARHEAYQFVDWAKSHGKVFRDWNAAWRTRCRNWWNYTGSKKGGQRLAGRAQPCAGGGGASITDAVLRRRALRQNSVDF